MYGGLPFNMLLNNVPHSRMSRNFIYKGAAEALVNAVQDPAVPRRMKVGTVGRCRVTTQGGSLFSLQPSHAPTKIQNETSNQI